MMNSWSSSPMHCFYAKFVAKLWFKPHRMLPPDNTVP